MEPRTLNNSVHLSGERSKLFSGDRYNNNGPLYQRQNQRMSSPVANDEPTLRDTNSVKKCQMCSKKFTRMFRQKKECNKCGVIACGKNFKTSCRCLGSKDDGSKMSGFNSSVPLSLFDLKTYETCPRFWLCKNVAPTSIFRCRDREVSANLSIGEEPVINIRTQLTPSILCSCDGGVSQKSFRSTEFHFDALKNQKFSRWTIASFIMDYLAVGETWLFVSLSGMESTFYGLTKVMIRRLQKFRRVNESLNIVCHNEDDVMVRIRGSFCWKIYNEEFDGPAPIGSSSPRSVAIVSGGNRLNCIRLEPTLNKLRSYYENYLFMAKNHEVQLIKDSPHPPKRNNKLDSGFAYSGYKRESNHVRYLPPISTQQQFSSNSRKATSAPIGNSEKDYQDVRNTARTRQILRIIDFVSSEYPNSNDQISLLCPICIKPVLCLNKSPSREVKNIPIKKDPLSRDQSSWSKIYLLD